VGNNGAVTSLIPKKKDYKLARIGLAWPFVTTLLGLAACQGSDYVEPADILFINGGVYTVDSERNWAEAAAIRDGAIVAVGNNNSVAAYADDGTEIIDLAGAIALPGFHDSHTHPLEGGYLMRYCDLTEEGTSVDAIVRFISQCASESDDEWIIGFGLDLALFDSNGPDKSLLDDIAPGRLFFIEAADGHSVLVNARVLELAGINGETPDPLGGVIERREDSDEPNGTLRETARDLADALRPKRQLQESIAAMRDAVRASNAAGVTSFIDAWAGEHELMTYQALEKSGELTVRVVNSIIDEGVFGKHFGEDFERVLATRNDYASELINNDSVKIMVDGVFEGETAALVDPYTGLGHNGNLNHTRAELLERVTRYDAMGLQVHMHTMGDGAVRAGLDAIEHAQEKNAGNPLSNDLRHHLSHLGLIHADDIARFASLNAAANFTGAWAYPSTWVLNLNVPVLGRERVDRMYPINSVHESGGVVVGGSDWIYGPLDPLESIEVAITRRDPNDANVPAGNTRDSIDLATAIDAYTINVAWLMHQEDKVGSIEIGKRADIVVLDKNLFEIPPAKINETSVLITIFDGKIVYRKPATE
jgi:predicted amidohydrolase YtcJ